MHSGTCVFWTPWDRQKCLDYQGVLIFQVILCDKAPFGTSNRWQVQVSTSTGFTLYLYAKGQEVYN